MIKCVDNLLPKPVLDRLLDTVAKMPWYYLPTNYMDNDWTFSHVLFKDYQEDSFKEISFLVASFVAERINLPVENLIRIRYGLILKRGEEPIIHAKHLDYDDIKNISATLYLNDNNGKIYTYDNNNNITDELTPKTNRLAIIDGDVLHSSSSPTDTMDRYAITFNFEVK